MLVKKIARIAADITSIVIVSHSILTKGTEFPNSSCPYKLHRTNRLTALPAKASVTNKKLAARHNMFRENTGEYPVFEPIVFLLTVRFDVFCPVYVSA
jgi:hypothetical protein